LEGKEYSRSGGGAFFLFLPCLMTLVFQAFHTSAASLVMRDARLGCTWHGAGVISGADGAG